MDFWAWAQTNLGANVVGGLIVALVVAAVGLIITIVRKSWRAAIWGNVARLFRFLFSIRLTTTKRLAKIERDAAPIIRFAPIGDKESLAASAAAQNARNKSNEPPEIPLPRPRWTIIRGAANPDPEDADSWLIRNAANGSIAKRVRVEARTIDFQFWDGATWDEMSGESIREFIGDALVHAQPRGWTFTVTWYDERAVQDSFDIHMPRLRSMTASELGIG